MTPPLLRYFWFHSINSLAASCSLQSAVCSLQMSYTALQGMQYKVSLPLPSFRSPKQFKNDFMLSLSTNFFIYNTIGNYYLHSNELKYFFSYNYTTVWHILNAIFCTHLTYKTYKLFKVLSGHSSNSIHSYTIQKSYPNLVWLISVEGTAVRQSCGLNRSDCERVRVELGYTVWLDWELTADNFSLVYISKVAFHRWTGHSFSLFPEIWMVNKLVWRAGLTNKWHLSLQFPWFGSSVLKPILQERENKT